MIQIRVLPIWGMKDEDFKDALVISIVSPSMEHPKIKGSNVHKFHFHDVTEEYFLEKQNRIIRPMEKEMAESIVEIAMSNRHCDEWVIHCEAGISRSPGVAIGLAKFIKTIPDEEELKRLFPCFNKHVCQLIEEAMEVKMNALEAEIELDAKCGGEEDMVFESIDMSVGILHTSQEHLSATDVRFAKFNGEVFCGHCRKDLWEVYKSSIGKE